MVLSGRVCTPTQKKVSILFQSTMVDLSTNGPDLKRVYDQVSDHKSDVNW